MKAIDKVDTVSARQFLEAAANEDDRMLFYTVYKFLKRGILDCIGSLTFRWTNIVKPTSHCIGNGLVESRSTGNNIMTLCNLEIVV